MERTITSLTAQKKNPNRINVFLDGEFAFGLSRIVSAWLKLDQKLSDKEIDKLLEKDQIEIAYQKALKYLSYRPRSEQEVVQRLRKAEFEEEIIQVVISRLLEKEYLGDEEFASMWVENRIAFRPRGARLISMELRQKGISEEIIQNALINLGDEFQLAYRSVKRIKYRLQGLERNTFWKKLSAYLGRKGFSFETIRLVMDDVWSELQTEEMESQILELEDIEDE
ncbi:MAG: RecX family transcriptional regulator [Anaerolineaceae bacterium]|nr:RecX family transcriptional regulator [Anaerolineaceae bacterium]